MSPKFQRMPSMKDLRYNLTVRKMVIFGIFTLIFCINIYKYNNIEKF